jgi:hypothetical protein
MMISMSLASMATLQYTPRQIAFVAGLFSTATAIPWAWATFTRRLPEPQPQAAEEPSETAPITPA